MSYLGFGYLDVHLVAPVALHEHLAVVEGDERKLLLHQLGNPDACTDRTSRRLFYVPVERFELNQPLGLHTG